MNFLKNRTIIGIICIVLSLIICFVVAPLFHQKIGEKTQIVRVIKPIKTGEEIKTDMVKTVEVGGYNLSKTVVRNVDTVIGKFASAALEPGDFILSSKIADEPVAENAYSGKLQSGDIVSVIAPDYKKQGTTVIPSELQYVEVIAVTANNGSDANTGETNHNTKDEKELPGTVTLLVTKEQSKILAELEADGTLHLSLVYRGDSENAKKFIEAQSNVLKKLYSKEKASEEKNETKQSDTVTMGNEVE